jgi:hypothetical protein
MDSPASQENGPLDIVLDFRLVNRDDHSFNDKFIQRNFILIVQTYSTSKNIAEIPLRDFRKVRPLIYHFRDIVPWTDRFPSVERGEINQKDQQYTLLLKQKNYSGNGLQTDQYRYETTPDVHGSISDGSASGHPVGLLFNRVEAYGKQGSRKKSLMLHFPRKGDAFYEEEIKSIINNQSFLLNNSDNSTMDIPLSPRTKTGPAGSAGPAGNASENSPSGQRCASDVESDLFNDRHAIIGGLILLLAIIVIVLAFVQFRHSGAFT